MKDEKALLIELANALDAASALARMIAESKHETVEIKLSSKRLAELIYKRVEDNFNETGETVTVDWECQSEISGAEEEHSP